MPGVERRSRHPATILREICLCVLQNSYVALTVEVRDPDLMDLPHPHPPERLLCGPGPTNVDPAVLDAMRKPMLGHLDPDLHDVLLDVVAMLRRVYRMPDGLVLPLHCTGTAGMETGITNLLE